MHTGTIYENMCEYIYTQEKCLKGQEVLKIANPASED